MNFNVEKITKEIIEFIRDYYDVNKLKGAVIGISGGKDSAVVAALFKEAIGSENVVGIWMPCHSKDDDKKNALLIAKELGIELKEHDLTKIYDEYVAQIKDNNQVSESDLNDSNINIKPRLRMATLYYYAAMLSKIKKGIYIVPGTGNKCELYVGYFTKGGDGVSDISVLADLTVDEVIAIGEYLKLPKEVIHRAPDDGLSGLTDEEKLGVKYSEISLAMDDIDNPKLSMDVRDKITKLHKVNSHKFVTPTYKRNSGNRLGIYMGSFNPVHQGHIDVVNYLLKSNYVDNILIIPTLEYWDKNNLMDIDERINMLKFFENDKIKIDTEHNKYVYTSELMEVLSREYDQELYLIIGADNIIQFDKWKNYQELLRYKIIIMNRDNIDIDKYLKKYKNGNFIVLKDYNYLPVSASQIRENRDIRYLDERVSKYIEEHNLWP